MKPSKIFSVLDLAVRARERGEIFNPLFVGDAGLGKSSIIQQWCKSKGLPFIDLRGAYLEAPDMIGFPKESTRKEANGKLRNITSHNLPEFWPFEGAGVLLLEEPNRATTAVMNTFMQFLTDRKIHNYQLPKDWIIVGAINPENEHYDVNTMDAALKNRFVIYEVEYDKKTFIQYMKDQEFEKSVVSFVESGSWTYVKPENLAKDAKHISPRTIAQLNTAVAAGLDADDEFLTYESILGKAVAKAFYAWVKDEKPVFFEDLSKQKKVALKRLKEYSDPSNYKNSQISITISDILENATNDKKTNKVTDDLLSDVIDVLPVDQSLSMVRDLEYKTKDFQLLKRLTDNYPNIKKIYKDVLNTK